MKRAPIAFNGSYSQMGGAPATSEDWSKVKITPAQQAAITEKATMFEASAPFYNAHSQLKGAFLPCRNYESPLYEPNVDPCNTWYNPNRCGFGCGAPTDPTVGAGCASKTGVIVTNPSLAQNLPKAVAVTQEGGNLGIRLPNNVLDSSLGYGPVANNRVKCCNNNANRPYTDRTSNIWYKQVCPPMNSGDCAGSGTIYGCGCGPTTYRQMLKGTPTY